MVLMDSLELQAMMDGQEREVTLGSLGFPDSQAEMDNLDKEE